MLYTEELICVSYMLVSSVSLFYQLRSQSFVTVECRDVWTFCLEDEERVSSLRYVFTERDMDNICNNQGSSGLLCFLVVSLTLFEILIFVAVTHAHHLKIKRRDIIITEKLSLRLTFTLVIITGILICLLLVLPLVQYYMLADTSHSAQGGFFNKILNSPPRAFLSFVITLITAPLRSIFHGQFTVELGLDGVYPNFKCVDPSRDRVANAFKCPMEATWTARVPEPSACRRDFYCADDCQVVFPRIIISSLAVIVASFALCYRLLRLRYNVRHSEETFGGQTEGELSLCKVANEHRSGGRKTVISRKTLGVLHRPEMKDKAVGSSKPAATSDFQGQTVYELKYSNVQGYQNGKNGVKVEDLRRNAHEGIANGRRECKVKEVNRWRNKNGDNRTRLSENGLVRRGLGRNCNQSEGLEELERYSSSEELGEGVLLVEDESEYYMSGFRL